MAHNHLTSETTGSGRSPANGVSRRGFLQAGAAAGGGLMLSLSLPLANSVAEAADSFAPNAFVRIGGEFLEGRSSAIVEPVELPQAK
jgi:isoquinoline 1-oxidoreductase beta subunit